MILNEIPKSWTLTNLGTVCKLRNGFAFKSDRYTNQGIPIIRISDIGEGKVDLKSCVKVEQDNQYLDYKVNKGDILVAMSGATTGKFGIFQSDQLAFQNQRVGRFEILEAKLLNNQFLLFLLYGLKHKILEDAYGGAQPNISSGKIEEMEIPLPPLPEQQRIVAKIGELFSELDKGIETLKTAQQQLKVYRQAVLKYAFEGKLTNPDVKEGELPEGWEYKSLNQFCKVETGTTPPKTNPEYYKDGNVPFYKPTDLEANANVNQSREYVSELGMNKARYVPEGSTLVTCIGATIGKTGLLTKGGVFNQQINAMIPFNHIVPKYLYYQTISPSFQEQIKLNASATTLPILNKGKFVELKMYICDPNEQQVIVQEIESRLSVCDKIEESIEQGLQQAEALRHSILMKAFEGKLVPQDPNDEPARVLLERIKAERAAAQPEKKTKTKKVKA